MDLASNIDINAIYTKIRFSNWKRFLFPICRHSQAASACHTVAPAHPMHLSTVTVTSHGSIQSHEQAELSQMLEQHNLNLHLCVGMALCSQMTFLSTSTYDSRGYHQAHLALSDCIAICVWALPHVTLLKTRNLAPQ